MRKIEISKELLEQELAGETVILDLASESYFGLNEVGTRIWQLLQKGSDRQGLLRVLLEEYDVERDQLEQDVNELLESLQEAGLIEFA